MLHFKYLILLLCFCTTVIPGEPPSLTGETESKTDDKLFDNDKDKKADDVTVDESSNNITTAPAEQSNVTESIESIVLPEVGSAAKEHSSSLAIFFLLFILILSIFLIHLLLKAKFHYLPESLAMGKLEISVHLHMI